MRDPVLNHNPHDGEEPALTLEYARIMNRLVSLALDRTGITFTSMACWQTLSTGCGPLLRFAWRTPCTFGVEKESIVNVRCWSQEVRFDAAKLAGVNDAKTEADDCRVCRRLSRQIWRRTTAP